MSPVSLTNTLTMKTNFELPSSDPMRNWHIESNPTTILVFVSCLCVSHPALKLRIPRTKHDLKHLGSLSWLKEIYNPQRSQWRDKIENNLHKHAQTSLFSLQRFQELIILNLLKFKWGTLFYFSFLMSKNII